MNPTRDGATRISTSQTLEFRDWKMRSELTVKVGTTALSMLPRSSRQSASRRMSPAALANRGSRTARVGEKGDRADPPLSHKWQYFKNVGQIARVKCRCDRVGEGLKDFGTN